MPSQLRLSLYCPRGMPGYHLPYVAGVANGAFAQQDLSVSLLEPAGGPDDIRRVAEDGADVCLTSVNHFVNAAAVLGDLPARFVAVVSQRHPIAALVRSDTPANVPADLSALRLAGSEKDTLTRELLAGLSYLGVPPPTLVDIPYADAPAALQSGAVEAIADYADLVPRVRGQSGVEVRAIRAGAPVYATGLVASDRLDDEVVEALRAAVVEALQQQRADPSLALDELVARYPEVDPADALEGWAYAEQCIFTESPLGEMTAYGWQQTLEHVSRTHGWPVPSAEGMCRAAFVTGSQAG